MSAQNNFLSLRVTLVQQRTSPGHSSFVEQCARGHARSMTDYWRSSTTTSSSSSSFSSTTSTTTMNAAPGGGVLEGIAVRGFLQRREQAQGITIGRGAIENAKLSVSRLLLRDGHDLQSLREAIFGLGNRR